MGTVKQVIATLVTFLFLTSSAKGSGGNEVNINIVAHEGSNVNLDLDIDQESNGCGCCNDNCHDSVAVSDSGCYRYGTYYPEYECITECGKKWTCINGVFVEGEIVPAPVDCDVVIDGVGCVTFHQLKLSFARADCFCLENGGQLVVVPDAAALHRLHYYMYTNLAGVSYWLGVEARHWMDGRPVADDEWRETYVTGPDGDPDECGTMFPGKYEYGVNDSPCDNGFYFICQYPNQYPIERPDTGCYWNGSFYYPDESVIDCGQNWTCINGEMSVSEYIPEPVECDEYKESFGCVIFHEKKRNFTRAKCLCEEDGGQLVVVPDAEALNSLHEYMVANLAGVSYWLGVEDQAWLDGRTVPADEWLGGAPDGDPDECGTMFPGADTYGVNDRPCNLGFYYICQYDNYFS